MSINSHVLSNSAQEKQIRRALKKAGYRLCKARGSVNADNLGGYMIVDLYGNYVVAGSRYSLDLSDVKAWLAD